MTTIKDLAIKHQYYCSDSNYYSNDCLYKHTSFRAFLSEIGDFDLDYNLVFRWDIKEKTDDEDEPTGEYYMEIFNMQQRRGRFVIIFIEKVTDKDVPDILKFLKPRFEHLKSLWQPL